MPLTGSTRFRVYKPWFRKYKMVLQVEVINLDLSPGETQPEQYVSWRDASLEDLTEILDIEVYNGLREIDTLGGEQ